jgi:hypothetical protein
MRAIVLLADAAQTESTGKAHALGLGWNVVGVPTPPHAVVVLMEVDRQEAEAGPHTITIKLFDQAGQPVVGRDAVGGAQEIGFAGEFTTALEQDAPEDVAARMSVAINIGPGLALSPGQRFEWRVTIDGKHDPSWVADFRTRPAPPASD